MLQMNDTENMCCMCEKSGRKSRLRLFQINLTEAVRLCSHENCTYPFESRTYDKLIVERDALTMTTCRSKKTQSIPSNDSKYSKSSLALIGLPGAENKTMINKEVSLQSPKSSLEGLKHRKTVTQFNLPIPSTNKTLKSYCVETSEQIRNNVNCDIKGKEIQLPKNNLHPRKVHVNDSASVVCHKGITDVNQSNMTPSQSAFSDMSTTNSDGKSSSHADSSKLKNIYTDRKTPECNSLINCPVYPNSSTLTEQNCYAEKVDCESSLSPCRFVYLQWQNRDAMCWLDVIMCMLVHSKTVQMAVKSKHVCSESIISKLVLTYNKTVEMINKNVLQKDSSSENLNPASTEDGIQLSGGPSKGCPNSVKSERTLQAQTGAGLRSSIAKMILLGNHSKAALEPHYSAALNHLHHIREKVFKCIQPKLLCVKGKNDSPVFALPILLKENNSIEKLFKLTYRTEFKCRHCGFSHCDKFEKTLPSFQYTVPDFNMQEPWFEQCCIQCHFSGQRKKLIFESVPKVLMMHFIEGIPFNDVDRLDFTENGVVYSVTAFVQYKKNPDHFVTWIRNSNELWQPQMQQNEDSAEELWMECDDLKSPLCQLQNKKPSFQPKQIHIVMWEKSGKPIPNPATPTVSNTTAEPGKPIPNPATPTVSNTAADSKSVSESLVSNILPMVSQHENTVDTKMITYVPSVTSIVGNTLLDNFRTVQNILLKTQSSENVPTLSSQNTDLKTSVDFSRNMLKPDKVSSVKPLGNLQLLRKVTHLQCRRARSSIQSEADVIKPIQKDIKRCNNKKRNSSSTKDESNSLVPPAAKKASLKKGNTVPNKAHTYFLPNSPVSPSLKERVSSRGKVYDGYIPKRTVVKSESQSTIGHSSSCIPSQSLPRTNPHSTSFSNYNTQQIMSNPAVSTSLTTSSDPHSTIGSQSCNLTMQHKISESDENSHMVSKKPISSSVSVEGNKKNLCLSSRSTTSRSHVNEVEVQADCPTPENIANNEEGFLSSEEMDEINSKVDEDFLNQITDISFTELSSSETLSEATENQSRGAVSTFLPLSNERECQILQDLYTALCIPAPSGSNNENK